MALVQGCLGHNRDVRDTLNAHKRGHGGGKEHGSHHYNPHRGGRYDSGEDQSRRPSPLLGPHVFSREILSAPVPPRYRPLANIQKYFRKTNPGLWLEYRLA